MEEGQGEGSVGQRKRFPLALLLPQREGTYFAGRSQIGVEQREETVFFFFLFCFGWEKKLWGSRQVSVGSIFGKIFQRMEKKIRFAKM